MIKIFFSRIFFCLAAITSARAANLDLKKHVELGALPESVHQLVVVSHQWGIKATVQAYQRRGSAWVAAKFGPFAAVIGKSGVAAIGAKREGDNKTPSGLYSLGMAFGYQPLALKLDYHVITVADKFIDDASSPEYNTWISGPTKAKSYESMLLSDDSYKLGVVINYNMNPVIAGIGSAIFMHVWPADGTIGTAGCIALSERSLYQLLMWLDKGQNPYILIR